MRVVFESRRSGANGSVSLAARLHRSFRAIGAAIGLTLTVIGAMALLLLGRYHPEVERTTAATKALRLNHELMLDHESGLRGYLLTRDDSFLVPVRLGRGRLEAQYQALTRLLARDAGLVALVVEVRLAQERWLAEWATAVEQGIASADIDEAMQRGTQLFDTYRVAAERLATDVVQRRDDALAAEGRILLGGILAETVIGACLVLVATSEHRRLRAATVEPVGHLLTAIERVRDGDLGARVHVDGPSEIVQLAAGLNDMTVALADHRGAATARAAEVAAQAEKLSLLLALAREVAGSLSLRYVCEAVATAGARVSGFARTVVWMVDEDRDVLAPLYDSTTPKGATVGMEVAGLGQGVVGEAAHLARTAHDGSRSVRGASAEPVLATELAIPMVVGARVVGVLQFTDDHPVSLLGRDLEVLETLAIHAAAALEAARLHRTTEEQAQLDALTRLHNRHRLDSDLDVECERSVRYQRPLAVIMVDVDHFKRFNDRHGHQAGNEALQLVSAVLQDGVRTSDSAYRYGGEEFVLLLRDGTGPGAVELAERLRLTLRERSTVLPEPVTASFGVATIPLDGTSPNELIAAADRALYEAKRMGRNQVVCTSRTADLLV